MVQQLIIIEHALAARCCRLQKSILCVSTLLCSDSQDFLLDWMRLVNIWTVFDRHLLSRHHCEVSDHFIWSEDLLFIVIRCYAWNALQILVWAWNSSSYTASSGVYAFLTHTTLSVHMHVLIGTTLHALSCTYSGVHAKSSNQPFEPADEKKGVMSRGCFWDMAIWSQAIGLICAVCGFFEQQ